MALVDRVATELWLDIFHHLYHLSKETLRAVSLTQRAFHSMSRQVIFADFSFRPYGLLGLSDLDLPLLPNEAADLALHLDRIEFWTSAEIAPLVRSCRIAPLIISPADGWSSDNGGAVLDVFLQKLPRFTALRQIHATYMNLAPALISLSCLPNLEHLRLEYSSQHQHSVKRVTILTPPSSLGWNELMQAMRSSHLRELVILVPALELQVLRAILHNTPTFPNVHRLSLSTLAATHAFTILVKFPAVDTPSFIGESQVGLQTDGRCNLPLLRSYSGPSNIFRGLTLPRLRELVIDDAWGVDSFFQVLEALPAPLNITLLAVTLRGFNYTALRTLCGNIPSLIELRVDVQASDAEPAAEAATFFDTLSSDPMVPPTLERLALCWPPRYGLYDPEGTDENNVPNLALLRDSLLLRCPRLRTLLVDGGYFVLSWSRGKGGIEEAIAVDRHAVFNLRLHLPTFWYIK
ncbi:hypothetical protein C8R46DRAFT_1101682 [Mycena filopes]|nr:hypothetical protein C8R46DRAFT_1101682 [Mycena filopes]